MFIIAGVGEKSKTENPAFYILEGETKNGSLICRFFTKNEKQIDKKLCVCYAEFTVDSKTNTVLMSLEKGVTAIGPLRFFIFGTG